MNILTKKCSTCDQVKPLDQFEKHRNQCKACRKAYAKKNYSKADNIIRRKKHYEENKTHIAIRQKEYRSKNKEKVAEYHKNRYTENKDKISKQHKEYRKNNKEKISVYGKEYRQENKENISVYRKKRYKENKERESAYSKKWAQENPERVLENRRNWYKNNPEYNKEYGEKYRSNPENKEKEAAKCKKWRKENPDKVAAKSNRYRASKLQRTPKWSDDKKILAVYTESDRLTKETGIQHHVDHIIPLQGELVSGLHVHTNLQVLTGGENCSKSNKFDPAYEAIQHAE